MKFETPKMNISIFETENVLTASGLTEEEKLERTKQKVQQDLTNAKVTNILNFTF